jgi:hypothetical protein
VNIYIVTEGKTEKIVFKHWIPMVNPSLSYIENLDELSINNFYIVSGKGYPYYFEIIEDAIDDVNQLQFDRLVLSMDSEEMSKQEKYDEVNEFILQKRCNSDIKIVVQHFCFEAWALGNRRLLRQNPSLPKLIDYKRFFNIKLNDPELLPAKHDEELNRSQLAEKYLCLAFNDRFRNLTYMKSNPQYIAHRTYLTQIRSRLTDTGHVASFGDFLEAFN